MMVARFLAAYVEAHDGYPPGWPNPTGHRELAEWGIRRLTATRVLLYEREFKQSQITIDPFDGMTERKTS